MNLDSVEQEKRIADPVASLVTVTVIALADVGKSLDHVRKESVAMHLALVGKESCIANMAANLSSCPLGYCCHVFNGCGKGKVYCGANCLPDYGSCDSASRCGPSYSSCPESACCSVRGTCGKGHDYCEPCICSPEYGFCDYSKGNCGQNLSPVDDKDGFDDIGSLKPTYSYLNMPAVTEILEDEKLGKESLCPTGLP
ncbi:hypothetical protein BT63DRAFT_453198 [Microthyrium microscopicum]|uniref:Chitin-binding type-1 domain-containing protein n=1 Tax=Microthyrium microscopicum TaxID=703497 RepID=A0A6A6UHC3_9PEZI|nr:hypothetical protein BT63DRAFT_453198 [Microthyrium microscopicum]